MGDLRKLSESDATQLKENTSISCFDTIIAAARNSGGETSPYATMDLTKFNRDGSPTYNPYEARYGDRWRQEIAETRHMRQYCYDNNIQYIR